MKSYLSMVPLYAKAHKRQNKMTNLCISIAVFLVTAIFSMTDVMVRQEMTHLVGKHGISQVKSLMQSTTARSIYPIAFLLFLFILMSAVLMIKGSMNSNISQRIKFFGMMRCIGMSRKQVMRMVRVEALNWCKRAVPVGILAGTLASWSLCGVLRFLVGEEFSTIPQFQISIIGIISGILVGVISVVLAAQKPAKRAASVSPIAAVADQRERKINTHLFSKKVVLKIEKLLGIKHALESKKNLLLMTTSFALSIILFLSFSVFVDLVNYIMPQSYSTPDLELTSVKEENDIAPELLEEIKALEGVKRVFARQSMLSVSSTCSEKTDIPEVDLISFDAYDLEGLEKDGLLEKGSDVAAVSDKDSNALVITGEELSSDAVITVNGQDIKVAGQLKYDPFQADGTIGEKTTLIVSDRTFQRVTGIDHYMLVMIQLDADASEDVKEKIQDMGNGIFTVTDKQEESTHGTYLAFLCCAYGFLGIIALVTLLHIVNSISMSVSANMKQYGAMRAVGMEEAQLIRMIASEAFVYAITGGAAGLIIGLIFSRWLYGFLVISHFKYAQYQLPVGQIMIIVLFLMVSVVVGVLIPAEHIKKISVTETINEL